MTETILSSLALLAALAGLGHSLWSARRAERRARSEHAARIAEDLGLMRVLCRSLGIRLGGQASLVDLAYPEDAYVPVRRKTTPALEAAVDDVVALS